jgi:hypothetical protein
VCGEDLGMLILILMLMLMLIVRSAWQDFT